MCDEDFESGDVQHYTWVRARKEHRCDACREAIRRGDRYHLAKLLADGSWDTWKHCARCWAMCEAIWRANGGAAIRFALDCGEDFAENFGNLPEGVARLAFLTADEAQQLVQSKEAGR